MTNFIQVKEMVQLHWPVTLELIIILISGSHPGTCSQCQGKGWVSWLLKRPPLMQFLASLRQAHVACVFHVESRHLLAGAALGFGEPLSSCEVKKSVMVGLIPLAHAVRCYFSQSEGRLGQWSRAHRFLGGVRVAGFNFCCLNPQSCSAPRFCSSSVLQPFMVLGTFTSL